MGLSTQPSVNPSTKSSIHPSEKVSFNPSVELSMNPSKKVSIEPSVEPTMGLSTQPSVNPSTKSSMHPSISNTVDPSSTFTFNGPQKIERASDVNDYAGTIPKPSTDYILKFTIEPQGQLLKTWSSIIHISSLGGGCCDYGTRVPAVWFEPDTTKIVVTAGFNGGGNPHLYASKQLAINTESKIEIRVVGKYCKLSINGVADSTMTIGDRSLLSDVKVYFGEPEHPAANAVLSNVYFGPA